MIYRKNGVIVEWVELGEGWNGDYNPDDPNDTELLRFDVSKVIKKKIVEVPDASYCTAVPATTPKEVQKEMLKYIWSQVEEEVRTGHSIKKLCERLSWISPKRFACWYNRERQLSKA